MAGRRAVPILRSRGGWTTTGTPPPKPPSEAPASPAAVAATVETSTEPATTKAARELSVTLPPTSLRAAGGVARRRTSREMRAVAEAQASAKRPSLRPGLQGEAGWSEDLLVGHGLLDAQHKKFFTLAARLAAACDAGHGVEEIQSALAFLEDYVRSHFASEERVMREVSYPHLESHVEAHAGFLRQVDRLKAEAATRADRARLARELAAMSMLWFAEHIRQVDRVLARFVTLEQK